MTARPTVDDVVDVVLGYYPGITRDWIMSEARYYSVTEPRQLAMALCYEMTGLSLPLIGRHFLRDHTTVRHAARVSFPKIKADRGAMIDDIRRDILARVAKRAAKASASAAAEPMPPVTREELLTVCAALRSAAETIAAALRVPSKHSNGQGVINEPVLQCEKLAPVPALRGPVAKVDQTPR